MKKRELALASRKEDTREKKNISIVQFELEEIKKHFDDSLDAIKRQFSIADELIQKGVQGDAEYIWRGQIVLLESAFDFFMHELTKYALYQIYNEKWQQTPKYNNIQVDMENVLRAIKEGNSSNWFLEFINGYFEKDTLVSFDSFKRQMNLLGIEVRDIADNVYYDANSTESTIDKFKMRLNQLFSRRNMIAHQFDRLHADAQLQPISKEMVDTFLCDMERIVNAICKESNDR